LLLLLTISQAQAGSVEHIEVWSRSDLYGMGLRARLDAAPDVVRDLLTDYERLGRINPSVKQSHVVDAPAPGTHRVRTLIELCVWVFCANLDQVQDMTLSADGELVATIVPEHGSFLSGWARWRFEPDGDGTRLSFDTELEPDFSIPAVVGPWLLQYTMRREAVVTVQGLERLARAKVQRR
jgi:carbon monoxide dehydrogenase subunit G